MDKEGRRCQNVRGVEGRTPQGTSDGIVQEGPNDIPYGKGNHLGGSVGYGKAVQVGTCAARPWSCQRQTTKRGATQCEFRDATKTQRGTIQVEWSTTETTGPAELLVKQTTV